MGQTLTALRVEDTAVPGEKMLRVEYSRAADNTSVPFSEETQHFADDSLPEIRPRFCLLPEMAPAFCGGFLTPALRKRYLLARGEQCRSLSFRPGSLITDTRPPPKGVEQYVALGERCRFVRGDFLAQDRDLARCCTQPNAQDCPERLRNGYSTPDCDAAMASFCAAQPGSAPCLAWLDTRRAPALAAYADICARDLYRSYCSQFVNVSRPEFFAYSDAAILQYCRTHRARRECWCVAPPTPRVRNAEVFLGPRVCWLHECTDQSRDRKYLLFDQDVQRKKCQYVGCNITVDMLQLENASATLVSDCVGTDAPGDESPGTRSAHVPALPVLPVTSALLAAAVLFYFLALYARRRVPDRPVRTRRR